VSRSDRQLLPSSMEALVVASPPAVLRVEAGMPVPRKIVDVAPLYPPAARSARVQGTVLIDVMIGVTGAVASVRVVRSIPLLDDAATDAVRQWRFTPTMLRGQAVPVVMTVGVNFALKRNRI
jgi:protein TonB